MTISFIFLIDLLLPLSMHTTELQTAKCDYKCFFYPGTLLDYKGWQMVNSRLCETARQSLSCAGPRPFQFLRRESEPLEICEYKPESFKDKLISPRLRIELLTFIISSDVLKAHQNFEVYCIVFYKVKTRRQLRKLKRYRTREGLGAKIEIPKRSKSPKKRHCEPFTIQLKFWNKSIFQKTVGHRCNNQLSNITLSKMLSLSI